MSNIEHSEHVSIEDAKLHVESVVNERENRWDHAYIYELDKKFYVFWHHENKYISTFLSPFANILWHAHVNLEVKNGQWHNSLTWEQRGQYTKEDYDTLAGVVGRKAADIIMDTNPDDKEKGG